MAARDSRQPGSDRGRPACDWEQAFVYWAALPPERRSYAAVAAEFGVSARTPGCSATSSSGFHGAQDLKVLPARTADQVALPTVPVTFVGVAVLIVNGSASTGVVKFSSWVVPATTIAPL